MVQVDYAAFKQRANKVKVAVVGDYMLDHYFFGSVTRLNPEKPVAPLITIEREVAYPGGAGNVVANVLSLGAQCAAFGNIGNDVQGTQLLHELSSRGADVQGVLRHADLTIQKTRLIGGGQYIARADRDGKLQQLLPADADRMLAELHAYAPSVVVVSDYAKGTITARLMAGLKNEVLVIVDPKPKKDNPGRNTIFHGSFLITPNEDEARLLSSAGDVHVIGKELLSHFKNVLITRGDKGMLLLQESGAMVDVPVKAKQVFDVTGAGDTVVAAIAVSLGAGYDMLTAVNIANHAAAISVSKVGTAAVTIDELKKYE